MSHRSASERALQADIRADEFRRQMSQAKAPTTWRLLRAVEDVLEARVAENVRHPPYLLPPGPQRDVLVAVSWTLAADAERGAEHSAKSAEYVEGLLAAVAK